MNVYSITSLFQPTLRHEVATALKKRRWGAVRFPTLPEDCGERTQQLPNWKL